MGIGYKIKTSSIILGIIILVLTVVQLTVFSSDFAYSQETNVLINLSDSEKFTDKRIITMYESKSKLLGDIDSQCNNWPIFSIDTPSQVTIGKEFDVILDYTFAIPDVDAGYEDPDAVLEPELFTACNMGNIYFDYPEYVEIVDAGYEHYDTLTDDNWYPPVVRNYGKIVYSFDNTAPQSKTITLKINESSSYDERSFFDIGMDGNDIRRHIDINGDVVTLSENSFGIIESELIWVGDVLNKTGTIKLINLNQLPQNEPPVELFADFLKKYHPGKNYEEIILSFNFTDTYVELFFEANPDMKN